MFWNLVLLLASFALQLVLSPKPQNAKAAALEDFKLPTADEGREIPVAFGTVWITGPNVVWYGDPLPSPRTSGRRYGLFGPKNVIGYWYHLGIHMIWCHGVPDALYEVRVGDKKLWNGINEGTQITVSEKGLFGGNNSEGGISGSFDVEFGASSQTQNDYLVDVLGSEIPAYRGVAGVVLRRMYVGTSPYIKPWAFKVKRILKTSTGAEQWYPEKAEIGTLLTTEVGNTILSDFTGLSWAFGCGSSYGGTFCTTDPSISDEYTVNGSTSVIYEVQFRVRGVVELQGYTGGETVSTYVIKDPNTPATAVNIYKIIVSDPPAEYALNHGDFDNTNLTALDYTLSIPVRGGATLTLFADSRDSGQVANNNSAEATDDDPAKPIIVSQPYDGQFMQIDAEAVYSVTGGVDMNPAHIIRECLTDANWGMGYTAADIDDTSFTAAADKLYDEEFGLSLQWTREEAIEEFIRTILAHIDAYLYVDRTTGKFVLKLIRNDYTVGDLPTFDDDDVVDWSEVQRRQPNEAVTSITVKYYQRSRRKEASRQFHNIAQIQQTGRTINATRNYPGINNASLAARVALRDARSLQAGLISGRLLGKRTFESLNPGDPFVLTSTRHGFSSVMRLVDARFGDGRQNAISVTFTQDVFNLEDDIVLEEDEGEVEEPYEDATATTPRLVWEMPYAELVDQVGETDTGTLLTNDPDGGLLQVAGGRPTTGALGAVLSVDAGSGYSDVDTLYFASVATLAANLSATATSATIVADDALSIDEIETGALAVIGDEIVRIDGLSGTTLTLGRGCLDSIPAAHSSGAKVLIYGLFNLSDFEPYTATDAVNVKLRTFTGAGELAQADAPVDSVTFASRAIRPLRPANVRVNGDDGFSGVVDATTGSPVAVEVTWVNRKRTAETGSAINAWTEGSAAAETGQTTVIELRDEADTLLQTYSGVTSPYTIPSGDYAGYNEVKVLAYAERDGYRSRNAHEITVLVAGSGNFLLETGDKLLLETGGTDNLLLE